MDLLKYSEISEEAKSFGTKLIAVSKTNPAAEILQLYYAGQRIFGENKVQELVDKYEVLPKDIEWHLIGHLQTNKVKFIVPFVAMIHSVDSLKLLQEIDKQAKKNNRIINCLLQIFIAQEETKFGLSESEVKALLDSKEFQQLSNIRICGLMGMATNTDDSAQTEKEFESLRILFLDLKKSFFTKDSSFTEISMGMSSDYKLALKHGSTMIRVGSVIFGNR